MKITALMILLLLAFVSNNVQARKPAVEDFVGVETENYKKTPEGAEVLFNFGNHLSKTQPEVVTQSSSYNWFSLASLFVFISLPFFMWFSITTAVKDTATPEAQTPPLTAKLDNVESLDNYRKNDEDHSEEKKAS